MAKGEAKKTNQLIDAERQRAGARGEADRTYYEGRRGVATGRDDDLRNKLLSGYESFANYSGNSGNSVGSGGGYVAPQYKLDDSLSSLEKRYGGLSGGLDTAYKKYGELADTGGYSDEDQRNIRARGSSTIPSFYGRLRDEMGRRAGMTGLSGSGFTTALDDRLSRQQARAAQEASLGTELGLSGAIREGKLQGLGGLERIGQYGYGGLRDIGGERQRILEQNESAAASARNANTGRANEEQEYINRMRMAGLGGLQELYGSSPAETARYEEMLMRDRGMTSDEQMNNIGMRAQYNPNRSGWDKFKDIMQIGGGIASAFAV